MTLCRFVLARRIFDMAVLEESLWIGKIYWYLHDQKQLNTVLCRWPHSREYMHYAVIASYSLHYALSSSHMFAIHSTLGLTCRRILNDMPHMLHYLRRTAAGNKITVFQLGATALKYLM